MTARGAAACACIVAALAAGCSAATRHKVLSIWFDGVPAPKEPAAAAAQQPSQPGQATAPRAGASSTHGPYAAKMCGACHEAGATNALVAPRDELCFRCHDLDLSKTFVHGPVVSGGCLVCHDPHSSGYRFLLVSDSDRFCFRCHDPQSVARIEGHDSAQANCTECHDAHGSNTRYLLK